MIDLSGLCFPRSNRGESEEGVSGLLLIWCPRNGDKLVFSVVLGSVVALPGATLLGLQVARTTSFFQIATVVVGLHGFPSFGFTLFSEVQLILF